MYKLPRRTASLSAVADVELKESELTEPALAPGYLCMGAAGAAAEGIVARVFGKMLANGNARGNATGKDGVGDVVLVGDVEPTVALRALG